LTVLAWLGALLILAAGGRILWRERPDLLVFYAGVIPLFSLVLITARDCNVTYVRHFILAIAFFLLLFSFVLADLWTQKRGRVICCLLLVAYLAANGRHMATLFEFGRGQYAEAIRFLAAESRGHLVTLGSDHDFDIRLVLPFHAETAMGDRKLAYYRWGHWPPEGPEWLICHQDSSSEPVPRWSQLKNDAGNRYECVKTFPAAPLSGSHWFIYHNQTREPNRI
jgi:hypothetical protein